MNQLCDALQAATAKLAQAPALSPAEIMAKLSILCARLRETLHLDAGDELVTYLLAESVREDCRLMADAELPGDLR